jgi:hypothetical protein
MPMTAQRGGGGVVCTHTQPTNEMAGQLHTLATVSPGKIQYSLYRRLGGPWDQLG